MAKLYGFKRFYFPVTERVVLSATPTVTNAVGPDNNPGYTEVMGLGRKDVGSVIDVNANTKTATIMAAVPTAFTAGHLYYLLAEVPVPASDDDYHFVGIPIAQKDLNNLIERRPQQDWASQFTNLRRSGAK